MMPNISITESNYESSGSSILRCADFIHGFTPVPSPSSVSSSLSEDQFEDAPEDVKHFVSPSILPSTLTNPLEALAIACISVSQTAPPLSNSATTFISETSSITLNDVLCGRGGLTNHHAGNIFFRRLVRMHQEAYVQATKRDKASVAKKIVDHIRNLNPSGRFLKKDSNGDWVDIGDRKAREKTSQALREGAPELREELNIDKESGETVDGKSIDCHNLLTASKIEGEFRDHIHPSIVIRPDQTKSSSSLGNRRRIVSSDSQEGIQEDHSRQHEFAYFYNQHHVILDDSMQYQLRKLRIGPDSEIQSPDSISSSFLPLQSKRKFMQALDEEKSENNDLNDHDAVRGPRLKLLKKRIQSEDEEVTLGSMV
jgi:hypothetical protein